MPLTEDELNAIEAQSLLVRERALEHHGVTAARWLQDSTRTYVPALIAALREAQAENARLRERLGSLGVAWHDTVHMSEINPDIDFAHCPKWSCREARAALAPASAREGT